MSFPTSRFVFGPAVAPRRQRIAQSFTGSAGVTPKLAKGGSVAGRDHDVLAQGRAVQIIDQDVVVSGDNADPVRPLGERGGRGAVGQGDLVGQGYGRHLLNTHDNHANQHYETHNGCHGQRGDKDFQKLNGSIQGDGLFGFINRSIVHVRALCRGSGYHRGKPACTP